MSSQKVFLPLYLKIVLFLYNWFTLIGIIYLLVAYLTSYLSIENELSIEFVYVLSFLILTYGLFQGYRRVKIIEGADTFEYGNFVSKLVIPFEMDKHGQRIIIQITFKTSGKSNSSKFEKNFYLIDSYSSKGDYDFRLIYNKRNPRKVVLFNSLPKIVKRYLLEWYEAA
tara:strand:+ start:2204 stop:2710 length:507 start_codon:yes stop_codon:yes gene_type:complete